MLKLSQATGVTEKLLCLLLGLIAIPVCCVKKRTYIKSAAIDLLGAKTALKLQAHRSCS
jgi:hypothetical protein